MLTAHPYDAADEARALAREPEWLNMGRSYTESVAYDFAVLGGYLRMHADRDIVMIVIGDHQPRRRRQRPGRAVDVPVHIIHQPSGNSGSPRRQRFPRGPDAFASEPVAHARARAGSARRVRQSRPPHAVSMADDRETQAILDEVRGYYAREHAEFDQVRTRPPHRL